MIAKIKTLILKAKYTYYSKRETHCMNKVSECIDNEQFDDAAMWAKKHTQYLKKECDTASELMSIGW